MKKIFIVAMALAAFVSCSKDDGVDKVLTSKEKSVSVTIQNSVISGTRATVTGATLDPTAKGGEAGLTKQVGIAGTEDAADGSTETLVADLRKLTILFANQAGRVLHAMPLVNTANENIHAPQDGTNDKDTNYVPGENDGNKVGGGVYEFHRVPEQVTRVAVIRDVTLTDPDDPEALDPEALKALVGKTLETIQTAATDESDRDVDVQSIFLYAEGDLKQGTQCYEEKENDVTTTYYYYTTTLNILPQYTRFELVSVSCYDLGNLNTDKKDGKDDISTVGLDHLTLNKFTIPLNNVDYTKTWTADPQNDWTLYGSACEAWDATKDAEKPCAKDAKTVITAGENMAWSWNMAPGTLHLATAPMVLKLDADSHHMFVNNPAKTVRVVSLNKEANFALDKGKVYRMALSFSESNIDETDDQLCVQATVVISDWTVVLVSPDFATKPNN